MDDPRAVAVERRHGVTTADEVVADIEAEPDAGGVRRGDQAFDLGGCFDVGAGVRMEREAVAAGDRLLGESVQDEREPVPASIREDGRRRIRGTPGGRIAVR